MNEPAGLPPACPPLLLTPRPVSLSVLTYVLSCWASAQGPTPALTFGYGSAASRIAFLITPCCCCCCCSASLSLCNTTATRGWRSLPSLPATASPPLAVAPSWCKGVFHRTAAFSWLGCPRADAPPCCCGHAASPPCWTPMKWHRTWERWPLLMLPHPHAALLTPVSPLPQGGCASPCAGLGCCRRGLRFRPHAFHARLPRARSVLRHGARDGVPRLLATTRPAQPRRRRHPLFLRLQAPGPEPAPIAACRISSCAQRRLLAPQSPSPR